MKALIDADVLRYEIGAVGEYNDPITGEHKIRDFELVKEMFHERVRQITEGARADSFTLFLTADKRTWSIARRSGMVQIGPEFIPNFRDAVSTDRVYKGTRKQEKPFHWINLTAYLLTFDGIMVANGCEADDLIAITHRLNPDETIICTRDKDLRMVAGHHYGWECGKQAEFGPITYDSLGKIDLVRSKSGNKIKGGGFLFFTSQLLTGDVVDNIGGLRGFGPIKTYELLSHCTSEREAFNTVKRTYEGMVGDNWKELLTEQCHLLWIIRERNEDGSLKHFNIEEWIDG